MYVQGSQECLRNAEQLLEDAKALLRNRSFGSAQSLIVTAMEEAGKAIILELADLNYVGKEVVEQSMRKHPPKKLVLLAMEKGLLFVDQIDRRNGSCVIDESVMQKLKKRLQKGLRKMENKRQNGFYVEVDLNNGAIVNSPNNIREFETEEFARKAESFLKLCGYLCEFFRHYMFDDTRGHTRSNLRVFQENLENLTTVYDEA